MEGRKGYRITFNSPVIITFSLICLAALILSLVTNGATNSLFFSVYRSSLLNPLTYVRMIGHVFGHSGWAHFIGNITLILLIGPLLEEKYGSLNLAIVIFITALVTGLSNFIFFPSTSLLGASGVVFAFIMMSSITSIKDKEIPLTFIFVAVIYIGGQIVDGIFVNDNISNITHIIGGGVGASLAFLMRSRNKSTMSS